MKGHLTYLIMRQTICIFMLANVHVVAVFAKMAYRVFVALMMGVCASVCLERERRGRTSEALDHHRDHRFNSPHPGRELAGSRLMYIAFQ